MGVDNNNTEKKNKEIKSSNKKNQIKNNQSKINTPKINNYVDLNNNKKKDSVNVRKQDTNKNKAEDQNKKLKQNLNSINNNDDVDSTKEQKIKVIRTRGYRHKKSRNKRLAITENETPQQIKYYYKFDKANNEKRLEVMLAPKPETNKKSNVDNNKNDDSTNMKNKKKNKKNNSRNDHFSLKSNENGNIGEIDINSILSEYEKENSKSENIVNNKYPLNHLYDAYHFRGSKLIRKTKSWYNNIPLFVVEKMPRKKYNKEYDISKDNIIVRRFSMSLASAYASNLSSKTWILKKYHPQKRNTEMSKEVLRQKKRKENKNNKNQILSKFIHYPAYDPFDETQEDYEPNFKYEEEVNIKIKKLYSMYQDDDNIEEGENLNNNANNSTINKLNKKNNKSITTPSSVNNNNLNSQKMVMNVNAKAFIPSEKILLNIKKSQESSKQSNTSKQTENLTSQKNSVTSNGLQQNNKSVSFSKTRLIPNYEVWNKYLDESREIKKKKLQIRQNSLNIIKKGYQRRTQYSHRVFGGNKTAIQNKKYKKSNNNKYYKNVWDNQRNGNVNNTMNNQITYQRYINYPNPTSNQMNIQLKNINQENQNNGRSVFYQQRIYVPYNNNNNNNNKYSVANPSFSSMKKQNQNIDQLNEKKINNTNSQPTYYNYNNNINGSSKITNNPYNNNEKTISHTQNNVKVVNNNKNILFKNNTEINEKSKKNTVQLNNEVNNTKINQGKSNSNNNKSININNDSNGFKNKNTFSNRNKNELNKNKENKNNVSNNHEETSLAIEIPTSSTSSPIKSSALSSKSASSFKSNSTNNDINNSDYNKSSNNYILVNPNETKFSFISQSRNNTDDKKFTTFKNNHTQKYYTGKEKSLKQNIPSHFNEKNSKNKNEVQTVNKKSDPATKNLLKIY